MHIFMTVEVTEDSVKPAVSIGPYSFAGMTSKPAEESLATVRHSGAILDRVLDFAEAIKS